ncbi:MAG: hypothetical protein JWR35_871 [Marmoricola sp.]|nr:hypothetical protein [Marmoricola sp.]
MTINENVTYTVADVENFGGTDAYKLNITGTITGGSGSTNVSGVGTATLKSFSGTVSGTRFVRRSDLALLQETQAQHLNGTATVSIISTGITADINLALTPAPGWRTHDFPLNSGDSWLNNENITYTGGFNYDAGSLGGTGSSPFDGTLPYNATSHVSSATINAGGNANLATDLIHSNNADNSMSDDIWWSPSFKNDAKEILQLPLDGAALTINRTLSSASLPSGNSLTSTATPSLTCAGGSVVVTGNLSTNASGVPVTVALDKSQINPGQTVSASTTTGTNGAYSATLTAPAESDLLAKNGSRANWGVVVSAPSVGALGATTVVVTPQDCGTLAYTGTTSAPQGGTAIVAAKLTDAAAPANAAGRTISFGLSGGSTVTGVTNASGVATANLPVAGPPRSATITATYVGASDLTAATASSPFAVTVDPTTTTVTPSQSIVTLGDTVTFTANVTPGIGSNPGGSVQFVVDGANFGSPVAVTAGSATSAALSGLPLGNHTVTAVYGGDANFATSTSAPVVFRVRNPLLPTTTTETVSPGSTVYGQSITLGSTVTAADGGTPTGSVTFTDGGTTIGTAALDGAGVASLVTTTLPVGSHSIVATYSGDDVYNGTASAPANVSVAKANVDLTIASSDTVTVSGESVNFNATIGATAPGSGVPSGAAQLVIDGSNVGDPVTLVGGVASFPPVTSLLTGIHTIAATYSGDANFVGASSALTQVVSQADTATTVTSSPSPSSEDQAVAITANVAAVSPGSGAPTGTIIFTSDGDEIGAASLHSTSGGSQATINVSTLLPGSHSIVASYAGDSDYASSESSPTSQTVISGAATVATSTVVTSSLNPSTYGQLISFKATVSAADDSSPVGAVQFSVDGANIGDPVPVDANGVAESLTLASPEPGGHTVIAAFVPVAGFSSSGGGVTQTVADAGVDVNLVSSAPGSTYGHGVSFTATVGSQQLGTGKPTGYVQFGVDGQPLGDAVAVADGVATSPSISTMLPGAHTVTAMYSGDADFVSKLASITQSVAQVSTSTTLTASATSTTFGQAIGFSAKVTPALGTLGAPGGTVTFLEGSTVLGTAPVVPAGTNGTAQITLAGLAAGAHSIKAVYSGSPSFVGSTSAALAVSVAKRATTISADAAVVKLLPLGLPLGQLRITLSSGLGPVAGVPVVFTIGGATICTSTTDASGVATCNAVSQLLTLVLNLGYRANFAGNANYQSSSAQGVVLK